jgi:glycosyltransferase involved in cell wall biosynthesis
MSWYSNYISIFEKPLSEISEDTIQRIRVQVISKQSETPLASVILIAHNEERHMLSCLWSLSENICDFPIEIIAVNNNSTDRTTEVMERAGVICLNETKKGPGHARQCGLDHARGKYHICIDSDTLYPPHYIQTMVNELQKPEVTCVFSLWSFMKDENHSRLGLFFYELLRDAFLILQSFKRPELCVRGMAFAFDTELGKKIGFRTDIKRGEDGSMALAMKPYGKLRFLFNRKARVLTCNSTINNDGSFFNSFSKRLRKGRQTFRSIFHSKKEYIDDESNLIK